MDTSDGKVDDMNGVLSEWLLMYTRIYKQIVSEKGKVGLVIDDCPRWKVTGHVSTFTLECPIHRRMHIAHTDKVSNLL